ncbi:MAG TPA: hypothetical protein VHI11_01765 [Jiangellaceae bacterium]|jgi:negative regulator of sigma E activity|nr:hypothetical protein [Jiangellaceae bacterium]
MTDGHLDPTVLAEHDQGLLPADRATEVDNHLAGCGSCSTTLARLGQLRSVLAEAPAEIEMPTAVAARIDRALAAEHADRRGVAAVEPTATVHPFRRRLPQLLAAAATVAAVAFGGYVVAMSGGGNDSDDSVTSAESAAGGDAGASDEGAGEGEGDGRQEDQASRRESAPEPVAAERTTLTDQIRAVAVGEYAAEGDASAPQHLEAGCGLTLARELDAELLGAVGTDVGAPDAVLIVVEADQPDVVRGVVLPACGDGAAEALRELTVSVD